MAATTTTASSIMKQFYEGPIQDEFNTFHPALSQIEKVTDRRKFTGNQVVIPRKTSRNRGIGARSESGAASPLSGTLPTAGNVGFGNATYNMVNLYVRGQLSGVAMAAVKDGRGAFGDILKLEMDGARESGRDMLHRMLWGDGSGVLTDVAQDHAASSTSITVNCTNWLQEGDLIDFITRAAGTLKHESVTISSIDSETTMTVDTGIDPNITESIYLANTYVGASTSRTPQEIWGFNALISDVDPYATDVHAHKTDDDNFGSASTQTLGGVARASNAGWKCSYVLAAVEMSDTFVELQRAYDTTDINIGTKPGMGLTSHAVVREIASEMLQHRRIGTTKTIQTGWEGLEFCNSVIMPDRYAGFPNGVVTSTATTDPLTAAVQALDFQTLYFITPSSLRWYVMRDWGFMDEDGSVLSRVANNDAYEFTLKTYRQFVALNPLKNCRVDNLIDPIA